LGQNKGIIWRYFSKITFICSYYKFCSIMFWKLKRS